jgi:hypothetical protein
VGGCGGVYTCTCRISVGKKCEGGGGGRGCIFAHV